MGIGIKEEAGVDFCLDVSYTVSNRACISVRVGWNVSMWNCTYEYDTQHIKKNDNNVIFFHVRRLYGRII